MDIIRLCAARCGTAVALRCWDYGNCVGDSAYTAIVDFISRHPASSFRRRYIKVWDGEKLAARANV